MNEIIINASTKYSVIVGKSLLSKIGHELKKVTKASNIVIISDSNVWPVYNQIVVGSLNNSGYSNIFPFVIEAGEQSKNGHTFLSALEFLAKNRITRNDCIIALGGGVVGDLAGFTAACYLRGIDYIQVPTSLLACVDSSVGGKTAIDLENGKNLAGAFYQPKLVLCDINTLDTLPESVFLDGCAEVIKYAILYDPNLFSHLMQHKKFFDRQYVISRCIELKRDVVLADEFDRGARQKLNLGHTFGHGIESATNFEISHGNAVAIGTAIITRAAAKYEFCSISDCTKILNLLESFSLPVKTFVSEEEIYNTALSDKKRFSNTLNLIIPRCIGDCQIVPVNVDQLPKILQAGL